MASRSFEIIPPERLQSTAAVDWSLCYLCQKDENVELQFPHNKKGKSTNSVTLKCLTYIFILLNYF